MSDGSSATGATGWADASGSTDATRANGANASADASRANVPIDARSSLGFARAK